MNKTTRMLAMTGIAVATGLTMGVGPASAAPRTGFGPPGRSGAARRIPRHAAPRTPAPPGASILTGIYIIILICPYCKRARKTARGKIRSCKEFLAMV